MNRCIRFCCLCLASIGILIAAFSGVSAAAEEGKGSYIVVFKEDVAAPGALAHSQAEQYNGKLGFVYRYAIKGYSAVLPAAAVTALEHNPNVAYISEDGPVSIAEEEVGIETEDNEGFESLEATIPTGISRSFAAGNKALDIDGQDDIRANVDVAVIDTGVDQSQPDLNVVGRTNCTVELESCIDNSGTDENSHGTHVAGTVGALDNGFGVVGVAPGARIWSVKVLNAAGNGTFSQVTAGVDWVTAHASEIEVANVSIGSNSTVLALNEAIVNSETHGVVYTIAAGNQNTEVKTSPANTGPAITVSAIADYDGKPGEKSPYTCENYGLDDHKASFSNYGKTVDIAAPGVCILSSKPGSSYGLKSGTSMAAPHVAGAAALLAAKNNPNSMKDVETITATLESTGNYNWVDTSGDGIKEPLLDLSNEKIYGLVSAPVVTTGAVTYAGTGSSTETFLTGNVNPKGLSTTYWFEYVEDAKYNPEAENPYAEGAKLPASPATLSGTVDKEYELKEPLTGLKAGTNYDYRLVAENSSGISKGTDQLFTSLAACKGAEGKCEWSIQSAANPTPQSENELEDVSCASATMCMAVGNDHYRGKGFSEVWNGSEWKVLSGTTGEMKAISCPTTTWCMTVAKSEDNGWQLKWVEIISGSWQTTTKAPPTPEGSTEVRLNDISCTSESACTAVGRYYASSEYKPYVARWNGSSWSLQTAPNPTEGNASEAMLSVSCSSSSFCMTVGRAASKPFAERWNGTEWSRVTAPNPEGATEATLEGISCTSSLWCAAVGNSKGGGTPNKTLVERWNGSSWSAVASPNPGGETYAKLRGVSCLSSTSCIGVGVNYTGFMPTKESTLAESWNGSEWTLQTTPNPEGKTFSSLTAIACSSTSACTAVGKARPESAETNMVTLAERWNGSNWSLQSAANPTPQNENELEDVSCASATMCMAVGSDHYRGKGFSEVWNGSEWKVLSTVTGEMKAVSCPTTTWCMTVAKTEDNGWQLKWTEFITGSWQTTTKSPPTPEGATEVKLRDVSCTSESACTAVGRYKTSEYKPYVARWNGSSWSLQTAPNPTEGDASEAMLSVSCSSSASCMTVGRAAGKPFAERWSGTEWTRVTAPNPEGATEATLEALSCSAASACMAVGNYKGSSGPNKTLAERWNGSSWSVISSPNPSGETYAKLRGVSCLSASSCIGVGVSYTGLIPSKESTLAESWNGSEWTLQTTPNPEGKSFSPLAAVSCSSAVACTAVGKAHPELGETNMVTLAERWQ